MLKIALVIPYYGKFPNYFNLFLKSCENNPDIDWFIFTDIETTLRFPENVHRIQMSFEEVKNIFQEKFDFEISLEQPYKLCDYKPAYGYVFNSYLNGYDYWGYCDIDMLFGNLRKYLPDDMLKEYDKIGYLGHLTLYKNKSDVNKLFMEVVNGKEIYREVFSTERICIFDEWGERNINNIFNVTGKKIWFWNNFCDIYPYDDNFCEAISFVEKKPELNCKILIKRKPLFILWDRGNVYRLSQKAGKLIKREYAYAHFQKRNMNINVDTSDDKILCTPNQFVKYDYLIAIQQLKKVRIVNRKRIRHRYSIIKYYAIEKTGPIRHIFRRTLNQWMKGKYD